MGRRTNHRRNMARGDFLGLRTRGTTPEERDALRSLREGRETLLEGLPHQTFESHGVTTTYYLMPPATGDGSSETDS